MRNRLSRICLAALLSSPLAAFGAEAAAPATLPSHEQSLRADAGLYAKTLGVDLDEAVRRLRLQTTVGELDAVLADLERDTFAGLWIEHTPSYRVVVRSTDPAAGERTLRAVRGTALDGLVEVRPATYSLAELETAQESAVQLARQAGDAVESEIDVKANWVKVHSRDAAALDRRLRGAGRALPAPVVVFQVDRLAQLQVDLYGGLPLSTCTTGFVVQDASGRRGLLTSGHCPDSQSYNGTPLVFRGQVFRRKFDVQWHSSDNFHFTPTFDSGVFVRPCQGIVPRGSQAIGSYVCKKGRAAGVACGVIVSTTFDPGTAIPDGIAKFIRVDNVFGGNLSQAGDSGGPWYSGNLAYGIHTGVPGDDRNDAFYMAINFASKLGVSVVLAPPGPF
ncbi:MAG TPA: S1 family peptidase [Thermoanaerobaculia bacterium]|nr:S1 family peptidase [Thermoanaerobaculia bacterium]